MFRIPMTENRERRSGNIIQLRQGSGKGTLPEAIRGEFKGKDHFLPGCPKRKTPKTFLRDEREKERKKKFQPR